MTPLKLGERVHVQNQNGSRSKKWDKTGIVVQLMGNRQYQVRMDGSGRLSLRNRRFLRPLGTQDANVELDDKSDGRQERRYPSRLRLSPARFTPGGGDNG